MLREIAHRVVAHPWVYDRAQALLGIKQVGEHLTPHLRVTEGRSVLEIGAGTGLWWSAVPRSAFYIWMDNDPVKLRGFLAKQPASAAMLGDATRLGLLDQSVDYVLCVAVTHHFTDEQFSAALREAARVGRYGLILLDAVECNESWISRLLWKYDRGSHPRSRTALMAAVAESFDIERYDTYTVYHQYVLCLARPKRDISGLQQTESG